LRGQSDGQYGPRQPRATKLDDFKPQLLDRLERAGQHQLPATVLLRELRERGYDGGVTQLKDYLRSIRPAHVQAHLQLRFAAIAAQQQRANYIQGPKVNKFVKQLREIIGDVSVHFGNRQCARAFRADRGARFHRIRA